MWLALMAPPAFCFLMFSPSVLVQDECAQAQTQPFFQIETHISKLKQASVGATAVLPKEYLKNQRNGATYLPCSYKISRVKPGH